MKIYRAVANPRTIRHRFAAAGGTRFRALPARRHGRMPQLHRSRPGNAGRRVPAPPARRPVPEPRSNGTDDR